MSHKSDCQCRVCQIADEHSEKLYPKRKIPAFAMAKFLEKKQQEEDIEMSKGIMKIDCPKCGHQVKVKIGPVIKCTACCGVIQ